MISRITKTKKRFCSTKTCFYNFSLILTFLIEILDCCTCSGVASRYCFILKGPKSSYYNKLLLLLGNLINKKGITEEGPEFMTLS